MWKTAAGVTARVIRLLIISPEWAIKLHQTVLTLRICSSIQIEAVTHSLTQKCANLVDTPPPRVTLILVECNCVLPAPVQTS